MNRLKAILSACASTIPGQDISGRIAVLPEMAAVDFDPKKFKHQPIPALKPRMLALIANARSLDRTGIPRGVAVRLGEILRVE